MSHLPRSSNGSTTQACAACKYQRRKCAPDCILAPYFPHDRQRQFLNAHKLFGVSNITKIIKNLDPFEKEEAMRTIIFQSDVRSLDPVGGCYRIIRDLQNQIEFTKNELNIVLHQLAICKAQAATHQVVDEDSLMQQHQFLQPYEPEAFVGQFENGVNNNNREEEVGVWGMQDSVSSSSSLHVKHGDSINDFDDIKLERSNDHHHHQLKFDPDDHKLVHQSEDDLLKMESVMLKEDTAQIQHQQAQDQQLKGAVATLFTFPNCDTIA